AVRALSLTASRSKTTTPAVSSSAAESREDSRFRTGIASVSPRNTTASSPLMIRVRVIGFLLSPSPHHVLQQPPADAAMRSRPEPEPFYRSAAHQRALRHFFVAWIVNPCLCMG